MIRLSQLIEELNKFPADSFVHIYDGEICCITVVAAEKGSHGFHDGIGYIKAGENDLEFEGHAVLYGQQEQ